MRILITEDEPYDMILSIDDLRAGIPEAKIISVFSVGQFLLKFNPPSLKRFDIIVTEHQLPLLRIGRSDEETTRSYHKLKERFPEVVGTDWEYHNGGEQIVRWMRLNGIQTPVLFYTHSDAVNIEDLLQYPNIHHLVKSENRGELSSAVKGYVYTKR